MNEREAFDEIKAGQEMATEGCPHFGDPEDCEQCRRDAGNAAEVRDLIGKADDALVQALISAGRARAAIEDLVSARVYDVELAEGTGGDDAVTELHRAALSLRHVHRIIASRKRLTDEEG